MPKKLAKKIVKQTFELPSQITKTAAEQVGMIPKKEEEKLKLTEQELKKKEKEERAQSMMKAAQIEAELLRLRQKRKEEELLRRERKPEEKEEESKKPLVEPQPKRPQGFLAGLKARLQKSRAELAGRRISG